MKPFVLVLLSGIAMLAFVTTQVVNEGRIRVGAGNNEQARVIFR